MKSKEKVNLYRNNFHLINLSHQKTILLETNWGQHLRSLKKKDVHILPPTSVSAENFIQKWGKYYTTNPGDLLFDNRYGQYATFFLLPR